MTNDPGPNVPSSNTPHSARSRHIPGSATADRFEFDPNVEETDPHHHIAVLYETPQQQFAAVVPFIRDGLERGDRCLYIYDDNDRAAVEAAMREAGIDVDAAVASGDLSFHSKDDSFLQDGDFEPDDTIDFATETIREATGEDGYDAVRITGEMTFVLDGDHDIEQMIEYEHALNDVFGTRPVLGICQYNVTDFDPEILNQIIRAHPNLVYDGTVRRNFYYLPSEEIVGGEHSPADQSVQSLLDRVTAYEQLQRREQGLSALSDATQELMQLDAGDITDRIGDIVREVLDVTFASVWVYDETTGELELQSGSSRDYQTVTTLADRYEERAWQAFVTGQTEVLDKLSTDISADPSQHQLRSGIIVPFGRHGVFCAGSIHPNVFDDPTVKLANTVGANIETALDRADRERTVEERNEKLERLNRINQVIREIGEALVEADTRDDIEAMVCERLAAADPYRFVWIGERDVETNTVTSRASAGGHDGYLDGVTITTDENGPAERGPISTALQTQTVQHVQDVLIDPAVKPWREATLAHGFRSWISIPLVYEQTSYGVLTLYSDEPNAFDEMERDVLAELGETIAHSIDAAETRETLQTDTVTELTLSVQELDDVLGCLAREVGCEIEFDGLVPSDGPVHHFFTIQDTDPDAVVASGSRIAGITDIELISDDETYCTFEATVIEPTLASRVVDQQAVLQSFSITDETSTLVVDLPPTTEVREFVETVRSVYPGTDLVTRHTRNRSIASQQDLRDTLDDRLTDRQREILEMAYLSDFFESPRTRTGNELSTALDISQPTFAHHLREAQRKLCELVFENA